jgi:hypothetical protein
VNEIPAIAALCADVSQPTLDLIRSIRTASPIPRHPDAARRAYKLRQRYRTPSAYPARGSFLWRHHHPSACNAAFAALSSFRLSAEAGYRGTISERPELPRRGGRAWATNCPEYKVTAVQVTPSNGPTEWQGVAANRRKGPSAGLSEHDKRRRIREEIMVKNQPQPGRKNPYDDAHKPQLRSHRSICGSNRTR